MGLLGIPVAVTSMVLRGLVDTTRAPLAIGRVAESLGRLASLADALHALPTDDVLARLDTLNVSLQRLASAEESLARLATMDGTLIELAGARAELARLADASAVLPALAEVAPALSRLAEAAHALESLARHATVLPAIAANSRTLPKLPDRMTGLEDTMDRLEASVRVLAEATAPLQGTTQRLGRLVDRLPERRRRDEDG
jgi:hypothetical protein